MISVPPEPSGEKVSQNWLWDLKGLVRNVQEIDRVYLCVWRGGGAPKHLSRDILNSFLEDYNIFPPIPY